jgi:hypothetical protein
MRSRQIAERLGVEEAHMLEFQQFNMIWDRKMSEYETHAEELVEAMKERHAAELRDYQRRLMGVQIKPKFSKDLLNLRKIQDTLAKQKEYVTHLFPSFLNSYIFLYCGYIICFSRTLFETLQTNLYTCLCLRYPYFFLLSFISLAMPKLIR